MPNTGLVLALKLDEQAGSAASVDIGWDTSNVSGFRIALGPGEPEHVHANKRSMIKLLQGAQIKQRPVTVHYAGSGPDIFAVEVEQFDLLSTGPAVRGDLFTLVGNAIPSDASLVVEASDGTTYPPVPLDIVRPTWIFVKAFPMAIPDGRYSVYLNSPTQGQSTRSTIDVVSMPYPIVRFLTDSSSTDPDPFTIVFVAGPVVLAGSDLLVDPIMNNRDDFNWAVDICLQNFFHSRFAEDLLRRDDIDSWIRIVSIFDWQLPLIMDNALVLAAGGTLLPNVPIYQFPLRYDVKPDVIVAFSRYQDVTKSLAYSMVDDLNGPTKSYTLDGSASMHGQGTQTPGVVALSHRNMSANTNIGMHEFCHALAAPLPAHQVADLYTDHEQGLAFLNINYKKKSAPTDPVPPFFANYQGVEYASDLTRSAAGGYGPPPDGWFSYHPELIDPGSPNLMDQPIGLNNRLDKLTYQYLSDRLQAKVLRS